MNCFPVKLEDQVMRFCVTRNRWALLLVCLAPSLALAGSLPDRFTLGKYVPERAWFFVHAVTNPERAWIDAKWAEVFEALKTTGIDRDIMDLIFSLMSEEDKTKAQASIDKATQLLRGVRWDDLVKYEFVFAEGISATPSSYGYLILTRGAENSGAANAAGLVAIFKEIAALSPKLAVVEAKMDDVEVWTLRIGVGKPEAPVMAFDLFRKGDIIGLAFDLPMGELEKTTRQTLEDVVQLMSGKSTKKSIVASARFQEALAQVKPPQDEVAFFDIKTLFADATRLLERIEGGMVAQQAKAKAAAAKEATAKEPDKAAEAQKPADDDEDDAEALAILRKIISQVDFLDYVVSTVETQGRRELKHEATRLQAGKETSPLASALVLRKPFEKFDKFIPAEATGFDLSGFIDLGALYQAAMDFIAKDVPDGQQIVAQIKGALAQIGFDPQRDLFDWWSGEMISIEMPAAVVTPMGGADSVLMVRVKNSELASQKVNAAIDAINNKLKSEGQMLMVTPAKVGAEGFREVTHPMFAMFVRPVVGVHGDWLMIGSSTGAVNKCLDVAAGKTPSIKENKRYQAEGLIPTGPVLAASFADTSNFGQEMAGVVGMVGFMGGMVTAGIPEDNPEAKKVKKAIQSGMSIVMKLGPVLQKIDFYSSESSLTTYDGKLTVHTESVVTYKDPAAAPATAKAP